MLALEAEVAANQAEGEMLFDARVDSSKPGGSTVRGQPSIQYRLRVKGQKAHYLKTNEVTPARAAIARGNDCGRHNGNCSECECSSIDWR
ncbi:MAG TPA: hypothetical protein V6D34_02490 [Candidatus Sericytochromatia bacterium]